MTPEQFCYWIQGFFEIEGGAIEHHALTFEQVRTIRDHLKEVFHKVTPTYKTGDSSTPINIPNTFTGTPTYQPPTFIC